MPINRHTVSIAVAIAFAWVAQSVGAADVTVQPSTGSGFVVKDASGANERLRVQETGAISLPGIIAAPPQAQGLCVGTGGQLGPCDSASSGNYGAGIGLNLSGTTFSVAPNYQLPQTCTANQIAQWNGTAWVCGNAGSSYSTGTGLVLSGTTFSVAPNYQLPQGCSVNQIPQWNGTACNCSTASSGATLPPGTVNQTLRYNASNALVANNLLQAFDDGGLLASGALDTGTIPFTGAGARMMWYPAKGAFRAGYVEASQWDDASVGYFSVAWGKNTTAVGNSSTAMGVDSTAPGHYSTAMGQNTHAVGNYSTAMGSNATAGGLYSTAMGENTNASGNYSTAMGEATTAAGHNSTALGYGTNASGSYSTAMGNGSVASGTSSTALGEGTAANGLAATAMGQDTIADGSVSTAMGSNVTTALHAGSFIYGDAASRSQVANTADNQFVVAAAGGVYFFTSCATTCTSGAGLAPGSGTWSSLSDRSAKTAVRPVDPREVLKKVAALPLNTWQYKTQEEKYRHMGPMAQDFYAAFHLGESDKGIDTVDADGVALAAIQGLNTLLAEGDAKAAARLDEKDREILALREEMARQARSREAQIAALRTEKNREIAELRAELATRVVALESMAGDLFEMKAQLHALRQSAPVPITIALQP